MSGLKGNASTKEIEAFEKGVTDLVAKHKDDFKDAPSIWNDVVLTALRYLIGAVIKVLTLGFCGSSLFQKPDSAAQNIVKEAAVALIDSERAMMPQRSGS